MMKNILLGFMIFFMGGGISFAGVGTTVFVDSYTNGNGTYINNYWRTNPNNYTVDNRSCLEHLNECFDGLDGEDFDRVLKIIDELQDLNDSWQTVRDDLKKEGVFYRTHLDKMESERKEAIATLYQSKLKSLDVYRMKAEMNREEERINTIELEKKYHNLFKKGYEAYESGDYDSSVKYYEEYLNMNGVKNNINYYNAKINLELAKQQLLGSKIKQANDTSSEIKLAKSSLGSKASIIEGLVPIIKSKDEATQQKISLILETFKASSDEYTRSVGIYLSYLLG